MHLEESGGEERSAVRADERAGQARPLCLFLLGRFASIRRRDSVARLLTGDGRLRVRLLDGFGAASLPRFLDALAERVGCVVGLCRCTSRSVMETDGGFQVGREMCSREEPRDPPR